MDENGFRLCLSRVRQIPLLQTDLLMTSRFFCLLRWKQFSCLLPWIPIVAFPLLAYWCSSKSKPNNQTDFEWESLRTQSLHSVYVPHAAWKQPPTVVNVVGPQYDASTMERTVWPHHKFRRRRRYVQLLLLVLLSTTTSGVYLYPTMHTCTLLHVISGEIRSIATVRYYYGWAS